MPKDICYFEYVEEVKKECSHEIVMAALNLKNAANGTKKPKKATKSTAQMALHI